MKPVNKILAFLLAMLLCAGVLASCDMADVLQKETTGSTQDTVPDELTENTLSPFVLPAGGYDGSEVTIAFYHAMNTSAAAVLESAIAEFNKLYPDIHVELIQSESHSAIYDTVGQFSSLEKKPNLVYCNSDLAALYAEAGYAIALDDLVNSRITMTDAANNTAILGLTDDQKADFIPAFYLEGTQFEDGRRYTLPLSKSADVLYYNKTFYDKAGLAVPETWDDVYSQIPVFQSQGMTTLPFAFSSGANRFITLCAQYGSEYTSATGNHFLYNNETNHDIIARTVDECMMYGLSPSDIYGTGVLTLFKNTDPAAKICYSVTASSADALLFLPEKVDDAYPFEVGVAPIPQVFPENRKVITHGSHVCIFNDANPQKVVASWLFTKFLTTDAKIQSELSMASGNMPVIQSATRLPAYQAFLSRADGGDHISALAIKAGLAQIDAFFAPPAFPGSLKAYEQVGRLIVECAEVNEGRDPQEYVPGMFEDSIKKCEKD